MKFICYSFLLILSISVLSCSEEDPEPTSGDIFFFVDRDWGCGTIDIQLQDQNTKTLTTFFEFEFPRCEDNPEVIYRNIEYGSYTWTGHGKFGCVWIGTIIHNASCSSVLLNDSHFMDKCLFTEGESCLSLEIVAQSIPDCPGGEQAGHLFKVTNNCSEDKVVYLCYLLNSGEYQSERFTTSIQSGVTRGVSVCQKELPEYKILSLGLADHQMYNCGALVVNCE